MCVCVCVFVGGWVGGCMRLYLWYVCFTWEGMYIAKPSFIVKLIPSMIMLYRPDNITYVCVQIFYQHTHTHTHSICTYMCIIQQCAVNGSATILPYYYGQHAIVDTAIMCILLVFVQWRLCVY